MPIESSQDTFYIAQGNTLPVLQTQLTDESGNAVNLQEATVNFRMEEARGGQIVFEKDCVIVDQSNGIVRYLWDDNDTEKPGRYRGTFVVDYTFGETQEFPNLGTRDVLIDGADRDAPIGDEVN